MTPIPYSGHEQNNTTLPVDFVCPECANSLESNEAMVCNQCGHVPRHGAD